MKAQHACEHSADTSPTAPTRICADATAPEGRVGHRKLRTIQGEALVLGAYQVARPARVRSTRKLVHELGTRERPSYKGKLSCMNTSHHPTTRLIGHRSRTNLLVFLGEPKSRPFASPTSALWRYEHSWSLVHCMHGNTSMVRTSFPLSPTHQTPTSASNNLVASDPTLPRYIARTFNRTPLSNATEAAKCN